MEEINVKRAELLKKLENNLVLHKQVYKESVVAFKKNFVTELKRMLANGKKGKYEFRVDLTPPQDHQQDYKDAIKMVKMDCREIVVLSQGEFFEYVLNKWNWMQTFRQIYVSNIRYGMSGSSGCSGTSGTSGSSGMSAAAKTYFGEDD